MAAIAAGGERGRPAHGSGGGVLFQPGGSCGSPPAGGGPPGGGPTAPPGGGPTDMPATPAVTSECFSLSISSFLCTISASSASTLDLVVMKSVSVVARSPAAIAGYTSLPNSINSVFFLFSSSITSAFILVHFAATSALWAPSFAFAFICSSMADSPADRVARE